MIRKIIPILVLLIMGCPLAWGESVSSERGTALETAKNRLASIDERLKAIDQLKTFDDAEVIPAFSQIIRNSKEPIVLRAHASEILSQSNNQWGTLELKKILRDLSVPSENRVIALYALWKKDAKAMKGELITLAQNNSEARDIRIAALNYLRTEKDKWPPEFWENLFLKKENPVPVRIQAMNGMKELGLILQPEMTLVQIIENPYEPFELRKAVILTANSMVSPEVFGKALISVLSNSENSLEMKRFALDNLAATADRTLLPQLKQIAPEEKNPVLSEELKTLISALSSKS